MFFDYTNEEVVEVKDGYRLFVEVPGVKKEDIEIEAEGSELVIAAVKKARDGTTLWSTTGSNRLLKRYRFDPSSISTEGMKASLEDGVLEVFLPKTNEKKPRRIEIQ
jgi:HSP20 family protein